MGLILVALTTASSLFSGEALAGGPSVSTVKGVYRRALRHDEDNDNFEGMRKPSSFRPSRITPHGQAGRFFRWLSPDPKKATSTSQILRTWSDWRPQVVALKGNGRVAKATFAIISNGAENTKVAIFDRATHQRLAWTADWTEYFAHHFQWEPGAPYTGNK